MCVGLPIVCGTVGHFGGMGWNPILRPDATFGGLGRRLWAERVNGLVLLGKRGLLSVWHLYSIRMALALRNPWLTERALRLLRLGLDVF